MWVKKKFFPVWPLGLGPWPWLEIRNFFFPNFFSPKFRNFCVFFYFFQNFPGIFWDFWKKIGKKIFLKKKLFWEFSEKKVGKKKLVVVGGGVGKKQNFNHGPWPWDFDFMEFFFQGYNVGKKFTPWVRDSGLNFFLFQKIFFPIFFFQKKSMKKKFSLKKHLKIFYYTYHHLDLKKKIEKQKLEKKTFLKKKKIGKKKMFWKKKICCDFLGEKNKFWKKKFFLKKKIGKKKFCSRAQGPGLRVRVYSWYEKKICCSPCSQFCFVLCVLHIQHITECWSLTLQ